MEILKLKIKISEIQNSLGEFNSQMEITEEKWIEGKQSSKTSSKVNNKEKMIFFKKNKQFRELLCDIRQSNIYINEILEGERKENGIEKNK